MFDLLHGWLCKTVSREPAAGSAPDEPPGGWVGVRRAARHCDEALTGTTRSWLRRLPARRRPLRLCLRYPRLANRIAWCWTDPALVEQVFDDLLNDRRGGRDGLPRGIVDELKRLRAYHTHLHGGQAPPPRRLWDAFLPR